MVAKFYINLDSSIERRKKMEDLFSSINMKVERVSAVDGRTPQNKILFEEIQLEPSKRILFERDLLPGEIGCYLSHLKCLKAFLKTDAEWALILEDDVKISKDLSVLLHNICWIPKNVSLIQLSSLLKSGETFFMEKKTITVNENYKLIHIIRPKPVGTQGYLINRKAAMDFISLSSKLKAPVDEILFSTDFSFARKHKNYTLYPCLISPCDDEISTIGENEGVRGYQEKRMISKFLKFNLKMKNSFNKKFSVRGEMSFMD